MSETCKSQTYMKIYGSNKLVLKQDRKITSGRDMKHKKRH